MTRPLSRFLAVVTLPAALCVALWAEPAADVRTADFALILESQPVAQRGLPAGQHAMALADIHARQLSVQSELRSRSITVTGSAATLVNAVFVRIPITRAAELQSISGVRLAVYLPPLRK